MWEWSTFTPSIPQPRPGRMRPSSHRSSWRDGPQDLFQPMREAVITADLDQLLARIQEVEARHPRIAQGLRRLAESFQYQKLLDLLSAEAPLES